MSRFERIAEWVPFLPLLAFLYGALIGFACVAVWLCGAIVLASLPVRLGGLDSLDRWKATMADFADRVAEKAGLGPG